LPLTFSIEDYKTISYIIKEEIEQVVFE